MYKFYFIIAYKVNKQTKKSTNKRKAKRDKSKFTLAAEFYSKTNRKWGAST